MKEYLMVMRGSFKEWENIGAEEKQNIMERYHAYVAMIREKSRLSGGAALKGGGYILRAANGTVVVDGPFTESKEALNGYFQFQATSFDEALEIAKQCPGLTHGKTIELSELSDS